MEQLIPWKRFWCPLGSTIDCGSQGFLRDPEDDFWSHAPKKVYEIKDLLKPNGPLILCGDPGMGKTTELRRIHTQLQQAQGFLIALNFRQQIADMADFRRLTIDSASWQAWREGDHLLTLSVDGIDEGLVRIPAFINLLTGLLVGEPINRLSLILTCRSLEWPTASGNELIGLWNQDRAVKSVYELCPLRQKDCDIAAKQAGCDATKFVEALYAKRIVGLAARPVTLFLLIQEFRQTAQFPSTHRTLFETGVTKLAHEIDLQRIEVQGKLSKTNMRAVSEDRMAAAQRIAAILLCCGKSAVERLKPGEQGNGNNFSPSQCFNKTSNAAIYGTEEILESALFTSVGEQACAFAHQTFAECLGAQQLAKLPLIQIRKLLLQTDSEGEYAIPQLAELASWTAGYHSDFCHHLLMTDPTALLRSDIALLSNKTKTSLVASILQGADNGTILDPYELYQFFFGLEHPNLGEQLLPYIQDRNHTRVARRIAIEIAERCRIAALTDSLLKVAYDQEDDLREEAAEAVSEIIDDERISELEPLAKGEIGPDPKDSMRGSALKRLIPNHWRIRDALPCLVRESNDRYIGSYHMLLSYTMPKHLDREDLVPILSWIANDRSCLDSAHARYKLSIVAIMMALENLNEVNISEAVTRLWFALAKTHHIHFLGRDKEFSTFIKSKDDIRHTLVIALLAEIPPGEKIDFYSIFDDVIKFNSETDFNWLLDHVSTSAPHVRDSLAAIIAGLAHGNTDIIIPYWDKFLSKVEDVPELSIRLSWLKAWDLKDPNTRSIKAQWLKRRREQQKIDRIWKSQLPDPRQLREQAFRECSNGSPDAWYDLWCALLHEEGQPHVKFWNPVVTSYPGWHSLSQAEREIAGIQAKQFLIHNVDASSWSENAYFTFAGIAAVWFLRSQLASDHELKEIVIKNWVGHCARCEHMDEDAPKELFKFAYELNAENALKSLFRQSDAEAHMRRPYALRRASKCWNAQISEATHCYLATIKDPATVRSGIEEWAEFDQQAAQTFAKEYLERCRPVENDSYPIGLRDALAAGLIIAPNYASDFSISYMARDIDLARSVWREVFYRRYSRTEDFFALMTESQISDLYSHLFQTFPRSTFPYMRKSGAVSSTQAVIDVRDRIAGILASKGTSEACCQLRQLMNNFPEELESLRWNLRQALINKRRNDWLPPAIESVVQIFENAEARLIQSEHDLLELVVESLRRYQRYLTGMTHPAVEALWNDVPASKKRPRILEPKDEECLSRSLARWLRDDIGLSNGVVANCEVKPREGSFTDIYVETFGKHSSAGFPTWTVVIEVKGCWHSKVKTAMHSQLVEGYLRPNGLYTGLYLVGWYVCDEWIDSENCTGQNTLAEATSWLQSTVACYDGKGTNELVRAFVLDCGWPSRSPSKAKSKAS